MSGLLMGLVFEVPFDGKFGRAEKQILLAYADHADQAGKNIYPSVDLISQKTGYSERSVQATTRTLEELGYLVSEGFGPSGTNRFSIPMIRTKEGGAKIAPLMLKSAPEGIAPPPLLKSAPEGIAPEESAPEPSVVVKPKEEEERKLSFDFSLSLQKALGEFGVYKSVFPAIANRLSEGWVEADILAIMAWMQSGKVEKSKAAQRFAIRIREGTKAPSNYYPWEHIAAEYADIQEDEPAEESEPNTAGMAWQSVLGQLKEQMPRRIYESASQAQVDYSDGVMRIQVRGDQAEWMQDRLTRLAERGLLGVLNREVTVKFVGLR
jgi:hypothetical protein